MSDDVETAVALPTRLSAADREAIEARTQAIGQQLLAEALAAQPSPVSPEWWAQQAGELATFDDDLKVRLFRLVDCMPMLDDPAALDRHVREYLDDSILERLPAALRLGLQAARSGLLAPLAARAVRAATLAQARRFIAGSTPAEAAAAALAERRHHRGFTLDLLGEAVTSDAEADAYAAAYTRLLEELPAQAARWARDPLVDDGPDGPLPRVNVSLKLSALDSSPAGTARRCMSTWSTTPRKISRSPSSSRSQPKRSFATGRIAASSSRRICAMPAAISKASPPGRGSGARPCGSGS
jgi:RHH-type proline utilization regulon transcriptional repressor/proline dehydrogenase/delta 1-pyrroline-5-carboxylate dehydrogenase